MLLDYLKTITSPMDLGTIKLKMDRRKYRTIAEFNADVTLMLHNCLHYNEEGSEISVVRASHYPLSSLSFKALIVSLFLHDSSGLSTSCSRGTCANRTLRV